MEVCDKTWKFNQNNLFIDIHNSVMKIHNSYLDSHIWYDMSKYTQFSFTIHTWSYSKS